MSKKYQKSIFLNSEGDSWFNRNKVSIEKNEKNILDIFLPFINSKDKILEIGCSDGNNLNYLFNKLPNHKLELYGIDPSKKSIKSGRHLYKNFNLKVGTSDKLEFDNKFFDIVICGFFLYLVDRDLLFRTVSEIDRVLKEDGFLVLVDFDVPFPLSNDYIHYKGIKSYKNDYSKFFTGGGHYTIVGKKQYCHEDEQSFNKNIQERISTTILYKEKIKNIYPQ